ncbi:hypothetical protein DH2020_019932 [Rehmannia glutinosa]|uniref:Fanconi-associated nuclease n=1 Tax=Rehmannia glutinosa TaxID=99300 RepID=A0ABR0WEN6_REHGL
MAEFLTLYEKDENVKRDSVEKRFDGGGDPVESVNCPVCGARLPGLDNTLINSHLGIGLFQNSQKSIYRSKVKIHSGQPVDKGNQVSPSEANGISACDIIHNLNELDSSEDYDNNHHSVSLGNNPFTSCVENLVSKDIVDNKSASPLSLSDVERPKYVLEEGLDNCDISQVFIPTSIVDRRYGIREELDPESRICLSRDLRMIKIQMLSRAVSLLYQKDSRAAVPIQIVCKNVVLCDQICCEDIQDFMSLWRHALRVVELARTNRSGMTRSWDGSYRQDGWFLLSGPWFRMSNISYPEIADCHQAIKSLLVILWKCNHGTRKQDIIDLLLSLSKDGLCPEIQSFVLEITGSCVKVSPLAESLLWRAEAIEISQIMVESLDENKSELVLRCIEMSVSRMSISFEEGKSSSGESMATFLSHFSASWVYSKVVLLGVSYLEREKRYTDAINLLKQLLSTFISDRRRGYWTLRLSVDLEHLGRVDDSLQAAEDGLLDPWVRAGARIALQRRVLRLGKPPRRWKIPSYSKSVKRKIFEVHVQGRPLNCKTGMKSVFYGEDGERCGVEQLALQYYAGEGGGWQGVHSESGIWLTIFGILMWDILFADVPNVFHNNFQTSPLDLETDTFYEARKSLIEAHLDKIQDGMAEEILITSFESHVGTACRGVNWEKHSLPDVRAAVKCIGGPCLASICRHLAQGYRSWSSGMPDLLLWRLHDCYKGEAKLVEVKGPRDRLSEQQRAWLLVLMDSGFNVEVCKVTPAPVAT